MSNATTLVHRVNQAAARQAGFHRTEAARRRVNSGTATAITLVAGRAAPRLIGERAHYTTLAGVPITYPTAYNWPKNYHASTLAVRVGIKWSGGCA